MSALLMFNRVEQHPSFTRYCMRIRNLLEQGQVLAAYLELTLDRQDYQDAYRDLRDLLKAQTHLQSLGFVETERLSNLVATLIGKYCSKDLKQSLEIHNLAWELFDFILIYSGKMVNEVACSVFPKLEGPEVAAFFTFTLRATQHHQFANQRK